MAVDNATVNLYVNNEQAKGAIAQLTKEYQDLKKARKEADAASDINKSLQLQAQERTALEKLKEAKRGVLDIEKAMANLSTLNLRQLATIRGKLKRELLDLNQGTEDYIKKQKQLTKVEEQLSNAQGRRTSGQMSFFQKVVATGVFAFLANGLKSIFKNAIDVRKEFEKYEAVLKNTLQSEVQMVQSMNMLKEVAKGTPFQLNELVAGFVKLVNQGFQPTKEEIIKMGDLASSTGKSFDQLVEAILDAQTGQFERLKEFGIKASKNGDMVKFTFKGVTTEIKNSSTAIQDYILGLGEMEGVLGSMASISETTEGKISNMGDAWDSLMNTMGSRTGGVVSYVLDALIDLIDMLEIASMSIDQIKAKASGEQDSKNLKAGIDEVELYKKKSLERGKTEKEATEYAVNLYKTGMQRTIDGYKEQIKSTSEAEKVRLNEKISSMEREQELVAAHYTKLENKQKGKNVPVSDKNKKSWSLDDDEIFINERLKLRQKLFNDEIKTEEEHSALLLALEIKTLEARITSKKESGKDLVKLQQSLFDKQYSQQKNEQTRLDRLLSASLEGASDTDTEQLIAVEKNSYEKRLKELGLFHKKKEDMTSEELSVVINLEKNHSAKVQKIYMDRIKREFDEKNTEVNRAIAQLKIKHNNELSEADSFAKKKALLSKWMNSEELHQVRTTRQADKALKDHYNFIEQQEAEKHWKGLITTFSNYMSEARRVTAEGNPMFNDQEIKRLQEIIDQLEQKLSEIKGVDLSVSNTPDTNNGDILGFSADKWATFFERMDTGTMKLNEWEMALKVVGEAFGEIINLMNAAEQREFKEYEKTANNKKKTLDQQLKKFRQSTMRQSNVVSIWNVNKPFVKKQWLSFRHWLIQPSV